ncbi:ABC transporter substrate-binding protein [Gloeothece verrucosa]|uniref:Extracellular ligand-binding receptor n=1 Tax=Gloeothece verrucosa (strain PCC 7822) TaxID=497965 RepID=E0UNU6_GLOV7|nr:ABC transporter substrate-binding protein [Gloeothece verrucosa]ADN18626.1 Extracellular ligand-binding receptor [Gloeothece verrucosa PCC 7822]
MNYNKKWTCDGIPKNPKYQGKGKSHSPVENRPNYPHCVDCGLPREAMIKPGGGGSKIGLMLGGATVILALGGVAAYGLRSQFVKPSSSSQCMVSGPNLETERVSSGERNLFSQNNINLDLKRGIEDFKLGNYETAAKFFEKAKEAARTDPEPKIYYNNALARYKKSPFKVAVVVPIDNKGTSAQEILRGVADAQEKFNQNGGAENRLLEVMIFNDGNDPQVAARIAQQISQDDTILGVIGHNSSEASQAALPCYQEKGIAMISPTSTSTSLKGNTFFRTVANDGVTAKVMGDYLTNDLNAKNIIIFYDSQSNYSKSLLQEIESQLPPAIIKDRIDINPPDFDVKANVDSSIQAGGDTAILLPSTETTSVAIRIAEEIKGRMKILGGDALYLPDTLIQGGNAVENMVVVAPVTPSDNYQTEANPSWGGQINWRTVAGFDATEALIEAIKNSPTNPTRQNIPTNLASINVNSEASGKALQFQEGERSSQPVLVIASKDAPAPKGAEFGFKPLSKP